MNTKTCQVKLNLCEELKLNDARQKLMILMSKDLNKLYYKKFPNVDDEKIGHSEEDWKLIYEMADKVSKDYAISFTELIKQDGEKYQENIKQTFLSKEIETCSEIESDTKRDDIWRTCRKLIQ